jgi:hypothetical protein
MEQQVMGALRVTTEITDDHEDETFCPFYVYYSSLQGNVQYLSIVIFMAELIESSPARPEVGRGLSRKWRLLHQALPGNSPLLAHRR